MQAFELAFAEGDKVEGPSWTACSEADFVVQGDGCSQTLDDGTTQYWLALNLTCNDESTDFAQVEVLVNATADGELSVEIQNASLSTDEQAPLTVGRGAALLLGGDG